MINDGEEIKIHLVSGPRKAWLSLSGSILSYRGKYWSKETLLDIPVELVSFTEKKRSMSSRLYTALLYLLIFPCIGLTIGGLWCVFTGSFPNSILLSCTGVGTLIGFLIFLYLMVRFFIREKTVSVHIASTDTPIVFWVEIDHCAELHEMMEEITRRKAMVDDTIPYPMKIAIGDEFYHPWKWTVVQTILFMFPGYVIRIPWLMLAGLIPIARYIYRYLMDASEPRQMRQAYKLYLKRDWEKARMLIDELIQINPDYMPARFFLFELKMRLGDFDGAEAFLTETHNELDTENLQSAQDAMVIRRRIAERKKEHFPIPCITSDVCAISEP